MRISYQYTFTHSSLIVVAMAVLGCAPENDLVNTEAEAVRPSSPSGNQAPQFAGPVVINDTGNGGSPSETPDIAGNGNGAAAADSTTTLVLFRNAPNPFNPATTLSFEIPVGGRQVTLVIHCVDGRRARRLVAANLASGEHTVVWHGRDDSGRKLPSGVYFACLRSGNEFRTRKLVMVQ